MGQEKLRRAPLLPDPNGGFSPLVSPGPRRLTANGTVKINPRQVPLRCERIDLGGVTISVPAASDFGGTLLATFAAGNFQFLGARLNASITVDANLAATLAAGNVDIGVGTAVASNVTLATTMIDLVAKVDVPAGGAVAGGGVTGQAATGDTIYVNASAACTVDGVITFAQGSYLDIIFLDTGV